QAVGDERRLFDRPRATTDEEFLRRHGHDVHFADVTPALHDQVVIGDRSLDRQAIWTDYDAPVLVFAVGDRLDLGIGEDGLYLFKGLALVALACRRLALFPPDLGDAVLLQQGIFEPRVENREPGIVPGEDPVDVLGRLLRDFLVLGPGRLESYDLVA